ncbi:MAG: Primosomal replication protein n [Betaproteobacteria bacterium ADurb.Bin341]|nr:MAG: Primosomal replication protein n [Betaproteobacteria bacterium ADurb.Bin341]
MRYTPAGVPIAEGVLQHTSEQMENGAARQVREDIPLLALGQAAQWLQATPIGSEIRTNGFLSAKSRDSRTLVLHINTIEFLEGTSNGPILQEKG